MKSGLSQMPCVNYSEWLWTHYAVKKRRTNWPSYSFFLPFTRYNLENVDLADIASFQFDLGRLYPFASALKQAWSLFTFNFIGSVLWICILFLKVQLVYKRYKIGVNWNQISPRTVKIFCLCTVNHQFEIPILTSHTFSPWPSLGEFKMVCHMVWYWWGVWHLNSEKSAIPTNSS